MTVGARISDGGHMGRIVAILLLVICLSACAAPAPTPPTAPTKAPQPTIAPMNLTPRPTPSAVKTAPPHSAIAVLNIKQEKQADGSVRTTASVTAEENLGVGQMEIASPETMLLGETRTIRLRIAPAAQLVSLTPVAAPGKTPDVPNFVYRFSGNVQLYPLMDAELRALTFDVKPTGTVRRIVQSSAAVSWDWLVTARAFGRQELSLELSIPVIVNGTSSELSTHVLQDVPIVIQVQAPTPTPTAAPMPTPTPESFGSRFMDSLMNNAVELLIALIGLVGTILGGIFVIVERMKPKGDV